MGLGFGSIIFIGIVALIVFGPKKLPALGKAVGESIREFKRATSSLHEDDESSKKQDER